MEYILHLFITICLYTLLSQSLNLSAGFSGLISLAHAGFYGIGAYTTAILTTQFGFTYLGTIPIALLVSGTFALIVSLIALRTVDDYFIICTLGIQIIFFSIMNNWMSLTKGPFGIPGIPTISIIGISFDTKFSFLLLSLFIVMVVWFLLLNISKSGFGKTLLAISEDEIYSLSIGKNVYISKTISYTISAMFASIPGSLYAHYLSYIDPSSFELSESIFVLSIVIIGGLGNLFGSFVASTFLVLLPEILRFVGMPDNIAANMRQIIYGLMLVLIMMTGRNGMDWLFSNFEKFKGRN